MFWSTPSQYRYAQSHDVYPFAHPGFGVVVALVAVVLLALHLAFPMDSPAEPITPAPHAMEIVPQE